MIKTPESSFPNSFRYCSTTNKYIDNYDTSIIKFVEITKKYKSNNSCILYLLKFNRSYIIGCYKIAKLINTIQLS